MTAANTVTYHSVNENLTRIQAVFVALAGLIFAVTGHWFPVVLLAYDFTARLFITPKISPFYLLAEAIVDKAVLANIPVDAEPKIFAAKIWLSASLFVLYFTLEGNYPSAVFIAAVLAFCSAAEALFNFCVGCKVYALLKRFNIEITSLKD